jgi:hypothetical protein
MKSNRIYITHCCAKKNNELKETREKTTPDILYVATPTQRFMNACKNKKVSWAIFSDKYAVWPYPLRHEWYEKNPNKVTDEEFRKLLEEFDKSLGSYKEIFFYYNPGRFHKLYKRLISKSKLKNRIRLFTHIREIN